MPESLGMGLVRYRVVAVQGLFQCHGHAGQFTYCHTERRVIKGETVEVMKQLKRREYDVSLPTWSWRGGREGRTEMDPILLACRYTCSLVLSSTLQVLRKQKDHAHSSIVKTRRCFHWKGSYFQLDTFRQPSNER